MRVRRSMTLPSLLNRSVDFVETGEAETLARYRGFASGFFAELYAAHRVLRGRFRFFREPATEDVWAVCSDPEFGVQLDPDLEVICIWDAHWHDEIGTWIDQPMGYAVEIIGQRYLTS